MKKIDYYDIITDSNGNPVYKPAQGTLVPDQNVIDRLGEYGIYPVYRKEGVLYEVIDAISGKILIDAREGVKRVKDIPAAIENIFTKLNDKPINHIINLCVNHAGDVKDPDGNTYIQRLENHFGDVSIWMSAGETAADEADVVEEEPVVEEDMNEVEAATAVPDLDDIVENGISVEKAKSLEGYFMSATDDEPEEDTKPAEEHKQQKMNKQQKHEQKFDMSAKRILNIITDGVSALADNHDKPAIVQTAELLKTIQKFF